MNACSFKLHILRVFMANYGLIPNKVRYCKLGFAAYQVTLTPQLFFFWKTELKTPVNYLEFYFLWLVVSLYY